MSNTIQVTVTTLRNKVSSLKSYNARLRAQINILKAVEAALNTMWDGEANEAFHKEFMKDLTQMINFYKAIEKYISSLEAIIQEYERAEQRNRDIANRRNYR